MRIFILTNTLTSVSSFCYSNHIAFHSYNARKYPDSQFFLYTPHRQSIDRSRNEAAVQAMQLECDYLMFIDDDILIPKDAFEKLKEADKDIIAALVYLRGYPFHTMAFKQLETSIDGRLQLGYYDDWEDNKDEDGLIKLAAVGFSCCLIKVDILNALQPPFFITGTNNTEDVYFCLRTRELSPNPSIYLHPDIKCGHMLNPEPIEYDTRKLQIEYCEGLVKMLNPITKDQNPRNKEYIKRNIASL